MIVYVSGPYSKGDVGENIRRACLAGDELLEKGYIPFIPHLSHLYHLISPKPWAMWLKLDLEYLSFCHAVLRLPGESTGADIEVKQAKEWFIPVYYSVSELEVEKG